MNKEEDVGRKSDISCIIQSVYNLNEQKSEEKKNMMENMKVKLFGIMTLCFMTAFHALGGSTARYSILVGNWSKDYDLKYEDGKKIGEGETVAITYTYGGSQFCGFNSDGSLVNPSNSTLVSVMKLKKNNSGVIVPVTLFRVSSDFHYVCTNGIWAAHVLDSRTMDVTNGELVLQSEENSTNMLVRSWMTIGKVVQPKTGTSRIGITGDVGEWSTTEGFFQDSVVLVDFEIDGVNAGSQVVTAGQDVNFPLVPEKEGKVFTGWHVDGCPGNTNCNCIAESLLLDGYSAWKKLVLMATYREIEVEEKKQTEDKADSMEGGESSGDVQISSQDTETGSGSGSSDSTIDQEEYQPEDVYGILPTRCRRNLMRKKNRSCYKKYANDQLVDMFEKTATKRVSYKGKIYVMKCRLFRIVPESLVEWASRSRSRMMKFSQKWVVEQVFIFDKTELIFCICDEDYNLIEVGRMEFVSSAERRRMLRIITKLDSLEMPD